MQVALYARVSTSQQEKTDTIESQLEALQAYVAAHDHTVLPEHIFLDNGVSGSRLDRPALDRLRDQARLGDFEAVILLSPDRLARSYPHQWLLLEEFKKYGCRVIFMENPFGDSPHGQLLAQMQGMMAEYERSQIADRTRRGRLHKARKAEFLPWAYRVYGYRYIPKHAGLPPRVEIHPEQAEVVRDMFRWLIQEQLTTRQIVKRLNALKIPTRTGQNAVWHVASVRCMLSNPIYTGQGHYNRPNRVSHARRPGGNFTRARTIMPGSRVPPRSGCPSRRRPSSVRRPLRKPRSSSTQSSQSPPRLSAHVAAVSLADARAVWPVSVAYASGAATERLQAL